MGGARTFIDWIKTNDHPCIKEYGTRLIELGASWDTFRTRDDIQEVMNDLVQSGGIPLLAAKDICKVVMSEIERSEAPMGIFWDMNMRGGDNAHAHVHAHAPPMIPTHLSGRCVVERIKSTLASVGSLKQFRGYGFTAVPQEKRSDLQLSGCHLVDSCSPRAHAHAHAHAHRLYDADHDRKDQEVADRMMIVVDAMQFAFSYPEGATLCFIIRGDDIDDYSYLLSVLRNKPQWRTIVISSGSWKQGDQFMMSDVNCDMKMCWETDVLLFHPPPPPLSPSISPPPGFLPLPSCPQQPASSDEERQSSIEKTNQLMTGSFVTCRPTSCLLEQPWSTALIKDTQLAESPTRGFPVIKSHQQTDVSFEGFAKDDEEWLDDANELLRAIVGNFSHISADPARTMKGPGTLKSQVGTILRQTNPVRFPTRAHVQSFLARAIESGIVVEVGTGGDKTLYLAKTDNNPRRSSSATQLNIPLSLEPPIAIEDMPAKALELSRSMPFILFIPKNRIPRGIKIPEKVFVQTSGTWLILMFKKLSSCEMIVAADPWLYQGTLVNWNKVKTTRNEMITDDHLQNSFHCTLCRTALELTIDAFVQGIDDDSNNDTTIAVNSTDKVMFCRSCFVSRPFWNETAKARVSDRVTSMLKEMAESDDMFVPKGILRKLLMSQWPNECASRDQGTLWIESTMDNKLVVELKHPISKAKVICLPIHRDWVYTSYNNLNVNTSAEMDFVEKMLWNSDHPSKVMTRVEIIKSIQEKFSTMSSPLLRTKMFLDAADRGLFYIAKGYHGQFVGLTKEDANAAAMGKSGEEEQTTCSIHVRSCKELPQTKPSIESKNDEDTEWNSCDAFSGEEDNSLSEVEYSGSIS